MSEKTDKPVLPKGWTWAKINDLALNPRADIVDGPFGSNLKATEYVDRGIPVLRLQNVGRNEFTKKNIKFITEEKAIQLSRHNCRPQDIIITKLGDPLGEACLLPADFDGGVVVADLVRFRISHPHLSKSYVVYGINSQSVMRQFEAKTKGTTRPRVNLSHIRDLDIPIPPLAEQHRIVAKIEELLTKLDAGVEELRKAKAQLKRYRQSVLKAAVTGELTREWREAHHHEVEPASELLTRILKERRARWEADQLNKMKVAGKVQNSDEWKKKYIEPSAPDTSDLSALPPGWIWSSLGQTFAVYVGATPSRAKSSYWKGDIHWVSSSEVAFCRIKETRETITELGLSNTSTDPHPTGTVLLGMIGEGKTRGQAAILDLRACNSQNSAAIRVSEVGLPPEFIYYFLEGEYQRTRTLGSGNNQPALNKSRVQAMLFPLPPIKEQHQIVEEVERLFSVTDAIENTIQQGLKQAARMRQSILKEAFEGKLVAQDPNDESSELLLERIKIERAKREAEQLAAKPSRKRLSKKRNKRSEGVAA